MTLDDLRAFEEVVRLRYPELTIRYKNESLTQRVLGYLIYSFNAEYMTRYTSTFAPAVYFPTQVFYEKNPKGSFTVLAHEFVHLLDTQKSPWWFRLSYIFPQALAPIAFAVYVALARTHAWPLGLLLVGAFCAMLIARISLAAFFVMLSLNLAAAVYFAVHCSGWASVALFVGLGLLAPWPAPGRVHWEKRGYAMSLAIYRWTFGSVPDVLRDSVAKQFLGPSYFFMSWRKAAVRAWIDQVVSKAESGELRQEDPYGLVYDFLHSRGMVK